MHPTGLHLCQQFVHLLGFRHEVSLPQKPPLGCNRISAIHYCQQVLGIEQTDDVINRVLIDRHTGVPSLDELVARIADGGVDLQRQDVHARHHDIFCHGLTEAENGIDHFPLTLLKRTLRLFVLHPVPEGIVRHRQGNFFGVFPKHRSHQAR